MIQGWKGKNKIKNKIILILTLASKNVLSIKMFEINFKHDFIIPLICIQNHSRKSVRKFSVRFEWV